MKLGTAVFVVVGGGGALVWWLSSQGDPATVSGGSERSVDRVLESTSMASPSEPQPSILSVPDEGASAAQGPHAEPAPLSTEERLSALLERTDPEAVSELRQLYGVLIASGEDPKGKLRGRILEYARALEDPLDTLDMVLSLVDQHEKCRSEMTRTAMSALRDALGRDSGVPAVAVSMLEREKGSAPSAHALMMSLLQHDCYDDHEEGGGSLDGFRDASVRAFQRFKGEDFRSHALGNLANAAGLEETAAVMAEEWLLDGGSPNFIHTVLTDEAAGSSLSQRLATQENRQLQKSLARVLIGVLESKPASLTQADATPAAQALLLLGQRHVVTRWATTPPRAFQGHQELLRAVEAKN